MRIFHKDCLPDGRMPSQLSADEYDELTAAPTAIPDEARPFVRITTKIVGGHAKDDEGKQRFEQYWVLKVGSYLRLFHHKTNRHDRMAIAVFYAGYFLFESSLLGYITREDNETIFANINNNLFLEARVTSINQWYKIKDASEKHPQYDVYLDINYYPGLNAPFDMILYSQAHLSKAVIDEFWNRGWRSSETISTAPDRALLSVKGVGPKILDRLRTLFPSC